MFTAVLVSIVSIPLQCWASPAAFSALLEHLAVPPACRPSTGAQSARERQLMRLQDYMEHGSFPLNVEYHYTTPIFVDSRKVPCAVAYLMMCDGYSGAVASIAAQNVTVRVMDVSHGALIEWLAGSGLSKAEAALVQPQYERGDSGEEIARCARMVPEVGTAEAFSSALMLGHLVRERARLREHFRAVLAELQTDTLLHSGIDTLLEAKDSEVLDASKGLGSMLEAVAESGTSGDANVIASNLCFLAPLLPVLHNVELYAQDFCKAARPQFIASGKYIGPPWTHASAAATLVEPLLREHSGYPPVRRNVIKQLSTCMDDVFGSQYLPYAPEGSNTTWESRYPQYDSCPLAATAYVDPWFERADLANAKLYGKAMRAFECNMHTAPVIAPPFQFYGMSGPYFPAAQWWGQTTRTFPSKVPRLSDKIVSACESKPDANGLSTNICLWDADQDNVFIAAIQACQAAGCVPTSSGRYWSSFTNYSACIQQEVWKPFTRKCLHPLHPCFQRLSPNVQGTGCPWSEPDRGTIWASAHSDMFLTLLSCAALALLLMVFFFNSRVVSSCPSRLRLCYLRHRKGGNTL